MLSSRPKSELQISTKKGTDDVSVVLSELFFNQSVISWQISIKLDSLAVM